MAPISHVIPVYPPAIKPSLALFGMGLGKKSDEKELVSKKDLSCNELGITLFQSLYCFHFNFRYVTLV